MEKLSHILTVYLVRKNVINAEKSSVYQYGFQIGLEVCLNTAISIVIAILCHMELEALVFFTVFILLRSYAGGLHLSTYIGCLICSCISLLGLLLLVKYLDVDNLFSLGIVFISLFLVKLIAPVQDVNRPLKTCELEKFRRKLNYSIKGIAILSIIFCWAKFDKMLFMISVTTAFMVCILAIGKIKYKKCIRKSNN